MKTESDKPSTGTRILDLAIAIPLAMLFTFPHIWLYQYIWAQFLAGTFGIAALPTRPLYGAICILGLMKMGLGRKDTDEDHEMPATTKTVSFGMFIGMIFMVVWVMSKVLR